MIITKKSIGRYEVCYNKGTYLWVEKIFRENETFYKAIRIYRTAEKVERKDKWMR